MRAKLHLLLVIIGSLAGIVFLSGGFLLILLGLLPSIVAYFIDSDPHKNFYRAVRACNLTGLLTLVFPPALHPQLAAALQVLMNDPMTWMILYGSAAAGWALVGACRLIAYVTFSVIGQTRTVFLERAQADLVKEWGEAITQAKAY